MGATKKLLDDMEHEYVLPVERPLPAFKISCSSIYKIVGKEGLGKTGETYLMEWVMAKRFGLKKDWYIKYVEKGLQVEPLAIELLSSVEGKVYEKNDEYFSDDDIQGIPDIIDGDVVTDIKASWDLYTYPLYKKKLPDVKYDWQLQGYTALTKKPQARIAYCLIDTPKPIVDRELKKLYYESGGRAEDWSPENWEQLAENYKFGFLSLQERVKIFEVKKDESKIKLIRERVQMCREYIKENFI